MGRFVCWAQLRLRWRGALRRLIFGGLLGAATLVENTPCFAQSDHAASHTWGHQYANVDHPDTAPDSPATSPAAFVASSKLQSRLPGFDDAAPVEHASGAARRNRPVTTTPLHNNAVAQRMSNYLIWLIALAVCGAIARLLIREARATPRADIVVDQRTTTRPTVTTTAALPSTVSDTAVTMAPLVDATTIAAQGNFALAIHTLLLRTLAALAHASAVPIRDAMTSREILANVTLPTRAAAALAELITVVERTHFGNAVPTEADFVACRAQYETFRRIYADLPSPSRAEDSTHPT